MNNPVVSIILTTQNQAHSLWRTILSALAQDFSRWEMLLVDCDSEDCTSEMAAQFTDPRISWFQAGKRNTAEARNFGLKHARGDYIAYLTPDCGWAPTFLSEMVSRAESDETSGLWYCDESFNHFINVSESRRALENMETIRHRQYSLDEARDFSSPSAHAILHRREIAGAIGGWDSAAPWFEDCDFFSRTLAMGEWMVSWVNRTLAEKRISTPAANSDGHPFSRRERYRRLAGKRYLHGKWARSLPRLVLQAELN